MSPESDRSSSGVRRMHRWFTHSLPGRAFLTAVGLKLIVLLLTPIGGASPVLGVLDFAGSVAFLVVGIGLVQQIAAEARRQRLLWHVRRKLTTSYIFIGFVPALLIITFFALCGLLLFFNVSSYLLESRVRALVDQGRFLAQSTVQELARVQGSAAAGALDERQRTAARRYPGVSYAVVPVQTCGAGGASGAGGAGGTGQAGGAGGTETAGLPADLSAVARSAKVEARSAQAGPWAHLEPPRELPPWIGCDGYAGLIAYQEPIEDGRTASVHTRIAVRAVALPEAGHTGSAVVVDIPIESAAAEQLRQETGIEIGDIDAIPAAATGVRPMAGRGAAAGVAAPNHSVELLAPHDTPGGVLEQPLRWFAFLDFTDWQTGKPGNVAVAIGMSPAEIYRRISATPVRIGGFSFGQVLLLLLALVGGLFLVIQAVAFVMGLGLARSITGSIHELFIGTGRIRQGDFTYKIPIRTRDQLGDLAESFNSMTSSIEGLMLEKAEKERLEQELRIARDIQMSLLPRGPLQMPGLALTGHCEPAREVGGDYYDFLTLDEHRLGVLIADVSGKGTSAALYMAELKGLMLALSQRHRSPRDLLIEANHILSEHLDSRSFITMTYAIIDLQARTLTYARAGHCPLIHLPGPHGPLQGLRVLAPDGMVLGLKLDKGEMFERFLEEQTFPLMPGDLVVLYTDGISEAMNDQLECFGETRLGELIEAHRDLPFEELRERIIREIRAFVGAGPQHDDMTILLLKVEPMGAVI